MERLIYPLSALALLFLVSCSEDTPEPPLADYNISNYYSGGKGTIFLQSSHAFSQPIGGLSKQEEDVHTDGDALFDAIFVTAGNKVNSGIGPLYNNNSCNACHPNDGRAIFPKDLNTTTGFFLRISSGNDPIMGPIDAKGFGGQLQQMAVPGLKPEVKFRVQYSPRVETFADGTKVVLQKPTYSVYDPYIPLPASYELSPRLAMPVIGLGLLEYIPESEILSYADPSDKNGDEISGRPNYVWNAEHKRTELGRFGWKANTSTVREQTAGAMANDMGLSNPIFPVEPCRNQSNGDDGKYNGIEISPSQLDAVEFYCQTLGVPARRNIKDNGVRRGEYLFTELGCALCHIPTMKTGSGKIKALSNQTIHAYTDMLLHDMGDGLADNRSDFLATGNEWKTRPLWGIGLTVTVNNHENYLHDGRAKTLEEAILWHGGEARTAKDKYKALSKTDRNNLIKFLRSL